MEVEAESSSLSATVGQQQPPLPPPTAAETTTSEPPIQMELPPPLRASELQPPGPEKKLYWDRSHYDSPESQMQALTKSSSLYVGNLSFTCRTVHVRAHFEQLGPVKEVIMGLDRNKKTPCGFCFVEYYDRPVALQAVSLLTGTKLDGNIIRVELDAGYRSGREYGRGMSGGQVRDDRRDRGRTKRPRTNGLYGSQNNHAMGSPEVKMDAALPSARDVVASGQFFGPTGTSTTTTNSNNRIDSNNNDNNDSGPATKMEIKEEDNNMMDQQHENNAQEHSGFRDDNNDDEDRPAAKRQKT